VQAPRSLKPGAIGHILECFSSLLLRGTDKCEPIYYVIVRKNRDDEGFGATPIKVALKWWMSC